MKAILIIINMILIYFFILKAFVSSRDMHIAQGLGLSTVEIKQ